MGGGGGQSHPLKPTNASTTFIINEMNFFLCKTNTLISFVDLQAVRLKPGEKCELAVTFCPKKTAVVSCKVKLYITNNPYEDQMVVIQGVGFMQDVVVDGLPLAKEQKSSLLDDRCV